MQKSSHLNTILLLITVDMIERFSVDDILKMKNEISEVIGFEYRGMFIYK
jgi:hypothetical protein